MDRVVKGARIGGSSRERLAAQLAQEYLAGATIRDLAARCGRSYGFVQTLLVETGVAMRARGGARPAAHARPPARPGAASTPPGGALAPQAAACAPAGEAEAAARVQGRKGNKGHKKGKAAKGKKKRSGKHKGKSGPKS